MRAREFVIERQQQQLNEFAPLAFAAPIIGTSLASMGLGALLWYGINGVLTGIQLYNTLEEYQELSAMYGPDPRGWPEEQQDDLLYSVYASIIMGVIGAAPKIAQGAGKLMSLAKNAFKETPKEAKKEALDKIAPKIEAEMKKMSKNKTGTTTPEPTTTTTPAPKTTTTQPTTATPKPASNISQAEKDKQAELKRRLQGNPETPQEKLKRELKAKQAANQNK